MDWTGAYGFYEAADYTQSNQPELVRSWMAHHQGMCLLAVTNLLKNNIVQDWFHGTPRGRRIHGPPVRPLRTARQGQMRLVQTSSRSSFGPCEVILRIEQFPFPRSRDIDNLPLRRQ